MERPTVFIGSSREGHSLAEAIQLNLDRECDVTIWSQGIFGLSTGTLESLTEILDSFDFAILVLTSDDLEVSRGETHNTPRDNVLLEMGLFIGSLGRHRTFMVFDRTKPPKLPSDMAGITPATYQPHAKGNMQAALGAACTQIKRSISKLGLRPHIETIPNGSAVAMAEEIARSYESIRKHEPASSLRNANMVNCVKEFQRIARYSRNFPINEWMDSPRSGLRLASYVFLYENPELSLLQPLAKQVCDRETLFFNILWGLFALRQGIGEFHPGMDSSSSLDESICEVDWTIFPPLIESLRRKKHGGPDIDFMISQIEELIWP